MILLERSDAGRQLAERLAECELQNPVVLAIPPGGVRIAWEIAQRLRAPMDVISTLEVIIPGELGMRVGAVADGIFLPAPRDRIRAGTPRDPDHVSRLVEFDIRRQKARDTAHRRGQPRLDVWNRDVVLVDDGWPTPDMVTVAVEAMRRRGAASIVYATPECQSEVLVRVGQDVRVESLYPRQGCRSVLMIDARVRPVNESETAELIRKSRRAGNLQAEPVMKAIPGWSAASQASRVALSHSGSVC